MDGNCIFCVSLGTKSQLFSVQSASWGCSWSPTLGIKRTSKVIGFFSPSLGWWTNCKKRKHMNQWLVNLPFAVLQRVGCSHPGLWQLSPGLFFIRARVRSSVIAAVMGMRDGRQLWGRTSQGEPIMSILQFALISHSQLYNRALMLLVTGDMWGHLPIIPSEQTPGTDVSTLHPESCPESRQHAAFPNTESCSPKDSLILHWFGKAWMDFCSENKLVLPLFLFQLFELFPVCLEVFIKLL